MVLILDLDDTLYPEASFVASGFQAVARMLHKRFGWRVDESLRIMHEELQHRGRGQVFDKLITENGAYSNRLRDRCISIYRSHHPKITLYESAKKFLKDYYREGLYLVTDGNKNVQASKIRALGIERYFNKIYITHRYGICHAKPSIYCFEKIRLTERSTWSNIAYIGDDPSKDFVGLNPMGALTIRVLTGRHKDSIPKPGFEPKITIESLAQLPAILTKR